jgi:hypothetical protein
MHNVERGFYPESFHFSTFQEAGEDTAGFRSGSQKLFVQRH